MNLLGGPTPLREPDLAVHSYRARPDAWHVKIIHEPTGLIGSGRGPTEQRAGAVALVALHLKVQKMGWKPDEQPH